MTFYARWVFFQGICFPSKCVPCLRIRDMIFCQTSSFRENAKKAQWPTTIEVNRRCQFPCYDMTLHPVLYETL